jgi:hypothetical protein
VHLSNRPSECLCAPGHPGVRVAAQLRGVGGGAGGRDPRPGRLANSEAGQMATLHQARSWGRSAFCLSVRWRHFTQARSWVRSAVCLSVCLGQPCSNPQPHTQACQSLASACGAISSASDCITGLCASLPALLLAPVLFAIQSVYLWTRLSGRTCRCHQPWVGPRGTSVPSWSQSVSQDNAFVAASANPVSLEWGLRVCLSSCSPSACLLGGPRRLRSGIRQPRQPRVGRTARGAPAGRSGRRRRCLQVRP